MAGILKENTNRIQKLFNDISALPKDRYDEGLAKGIEFINAVIERTITEITAEDFAVTRIGNYAFYNCQKLTSVTIPNGVTVIGNNAFYLCQYLVNLTIPDSVNAIQQSAFSLCTRLPSVTIGSGITKIDGSAFSSCNELKKITILAETPPTIQSNTFSSVPADCAFYVPAQSVEAYKTATNWSARADYIFAIEE